MRELERVGIRKTEKSWDQKPSRTSETSPLWHTGLSKTMIHFPLCHLKKTKLERSISQTESKLIEVRLKLASTFSLRHLPTCSTGKRAGSSAQSRRQFPQVKEAEVRIWRCTDFPGQDHRKEGTAQELEILCTICL